MRQELSYIWHIKVKVYANRLRNYCHDIKPDSFCLSAFNLFVLYSKCLRFIYACF